ncbi:hypothetical protein COCVIDRAFT_31331 [Bipolaris victoriae FI3]|uniref:Uncharacterized protein n=1 Tax=Bipolaris victoriae (strain FI3) TaxID=930091 RepID=W7EBL8_BIPV3|nr:hypothetical protein COCVIDRAFT_31331 [Bipolaris victoriae FI3]
MNDWLPLSMSQATADGPRDKGVPLQLSIAEGGTHAYDLFPLSQVDGAGVENLEVANAEVGEPALDSVAHLKGVDGRRS